MKDLRSLGDAFEKEGAWQDDWGRDDKRGRRSVDWFGWLQSFFFVGVIDSLRVFESLAWKEGVKFLDEDVMWVLRVFAFRTVWCLSLCKTSQFRDESFELLRRNWALECECDENWKSGLNDEDQNRIERVKWDFKDEHLSWSLLETLVL